MKIYFVNIKGFDPALPWDYDELMNRATCAPPIFTQGNNSPKAFEMPVGMTMKDQLLVINDVKTFKLKYPFTKTLPLQDPMKSPSGDAFFNKRVSPNRPRLNSSYKKSKKEDYDSILLTSLIHSDSNPEIVRETIAYPGIYERQKKAEREAKYLKNSASLFKTSIRTNELKVNLLDVIEVTLKIVNESYANFCQQKQLSDEIKNEICEYFRHAIMQTMFNSSFRKAPDEFQNLQADTIFYKNSEAHSYFCKQSRLLKLQALTLNWQALIDDNLDMKYSTAATMSLDMQGALKNFKVFLASASMSREMQEALKTSLEMQEKLKNFEFLFQSDLQIKNNLSILVGKMGDILIELGLAEQNQDKLVNAITQPIINNYYSLLYMLSNQMRLLPIQKMPYDLHLEYPPKIAKDILSCLVNQLSKSLEFGKKEYEPLMSQFSYYDSDIFINPDWITKIEEKIKLIIEGKKFPKELTPSSSPLVAEKFKAGIFECLQSLLESHVLVDSYSPVLNFKLTSCS